MRSLVAPTAYNGTLSPTQAAQVIAANLDGEVDLCPIADGGTGWLEVWAYQFPDAQRHAVEAPDGSSSHSARRGCSRASCASIACRCASGRWYAHTSSQPVPPSAIGHRSASPSKFAAITCAACVGESVPL